MIKNNTYYVYKYNNCKYFDLEIPENYILMAQIYNLKYDMYLNKFGVGIAYSNFKVSYNMYSVSMIYNINKHINFNNLPHNFYTPQDIKDKKYDEFWFENNFIQITDNAIINNRIIKMINLGLNVF